LEAGQMESALLLYKNRLADSVRLIVRTCVLEYISTFDPTSAVQLLEDGFADEDAPIAGKVRDMDDASFISCIAMSLENLTLAIQRATRVHRILDNQEKFDNKGIGSTSLEISKSCVNASCELAQRSVAQLLGLRKERNAKMDYSRVYELRKHIEIFITNVQNKRNIGIVVTTTVYELKQAVSTMSKLHVEYSHEQNKSKLVSVLESERWQVCDVTTDRQRIIDSLAHGKMALMSSSSKNMSSMTNKSSNNDMESITDIKVKTKSSIYDNSDKNNNIKCAIVDSREYRVVWSVLLLLENIINYLQIAITFPTVTIDVIPKVVELIRLFDQRTRQLVLGAGAIHSIARLKNISAKHLAVTSQSVLLLIALLPHIRAALLAKLPSNRQMLLTELDRTSQVLLDHHSQLLSKFVSIVSEACDSSAAGLAQIDWSVFTGGADYFDQLGKNASALHRVLCGILPTEQLTDVFARIVAVINRKVVAHFETVNPASPAARRAIVDDVTNLVDTYFSRIPVVDISTVLLEEAFRKKYLETLI
jgi:vacuolar protein sorting-associated protein 54